MIADATAKEMALRFPGFIFFRTSTIAFSLLNATSDNRMVPNYRMCFSPFLVENKEEVYI
ncbi:hypothetical protein bcgnr5390_16850 [Bacillus luti]|nr:hypothetical protein BC2903_54110 [Bacillus cereus]